MRPDMMLRPGLVAILTRQSAARKLGPVVQTPCRWRSSSTQRHSGGVLRWALLGSGCVCLTLGGTLGYAVYDTEFRRKLEATVPMADRLLAVLTRYRLPAGSNGDVLKLSSPLFPNVHQPERTSHQFGVDTLSSTQSASSATTAKAEQYGTALSGVNDLSPPAAEPYSVESAQYQLPGHTEVTGGHKRDESPSLDQLSRTVLDSVNAAIAAQQSAVNAAANHSELLFDSISERATPDSERDIAQSAHLRNHLSDTADRLAAVANHNLAALRQAVERAIIVSSGTSDETADELVTARFTLATAHSSLQLAKQARHVSLPAVAASADGADGATDAFGGPHLFDTGDSSGRSSPASSSSSAAASASSLSSAERRALELSFGRQLSVYREELDSQLRQQLRSQIAAHCDHLQDELAAQRAELERVHRSLLEHRLRQQRHDIDLQRADLLGQVQGVQQALQERVHVDRTALFSQRMWTVCQAFYEAVINQSTATSGDELCNQRIPIAQHVQLVKQTAEPGDRVVDSVLTALPAAAVASGVVSQCQLQRRFDRLQRVCRRVALIDDRGASLYKYAVSFVYSLLVIDAYTATADSLYTETLSTDNVDTFGLIARAKHAMQLGDLSLAVRLMGQLRGEPLRAASDWLADSRQLLEVQLAAEAIMAHVGATGTAATAPCRDTQ